MIYFIQETGLLRNRVKIGHTRNLKIRLQNIKTDCPSSVRVLLTLPGNEHKEFAYHKQFARYRVHGEWFRYGIRLRWFIFLSNYWEKEYPKEEIEVSSLEGIELDFQDSVEVSIGENIYTVDLMELENFLKIAWERQISGKNGLSRRYWMGHQSLSKKQYEVYIKVLNSIPKLISNRKHRASGTLAFDPKYVLDSIKSFNTDLT